MSDGMGGWLTYLFFTYNLSLFYPELGYLNILLLENECKLMNKRGVCQITSILTLPLHYQILIIKSSSLIQLKNEIVLTFVV